ncbi:MvdC/MvdD family ATP grasp protein [Olivibacter jilunii]|uniref:MvdC/MvdD family ATP grasp protein n=1 Tax=Olivibacter jilunii TaxID=985016 RepID=UPI003F5CE7FC
MILCITHSSDFYTIDIVQNALNRMGVPSIRLNVDEFAINYRIHYDFTDNGRQLYRLNINGLTIESSQITAVWYRKLWDLTVPDDLDLTYRSVFVKEYRTYLQLFFDSLKDLYWINDMQVDHAVGGNKIYQLKIANRVGLRVPKTIISNEAATIRAFYKSCVNGTIMKLHGALEKSMHAKSFLPTIKLADEDLKNLEELSYCPMIFQEYIDKLYELRIIYVDGEFFTGKIQHKEMQTDWRITRGSSPSWERYPLPNEIKHKLRRMMQRLNLGFGAIDMIRNREGAYIFLEINPQGEWGMLQKELNYKIGETLAEKLIEHARKNEQ